MRECMIVGLVVVSTAVVVVGFLHLASDAAWFMQPAGALLGPPLTCIR